MFVRYVLDLDADMTLKIRSFHSIRLIFNKNYIKMNRNYKYNEKT